MNKFPIAIFAALWVPCLMIDANYLGGTGLFAIASLVGLGMLALQVFRAKLAVDPIADGNQSNASDEIEAAQRKHDVCS